MSLKRLVPRFRYFVLLMVFPFCRAGGQPDCNISGSTRICSGAETVWSGPEGMLTYLWTGPGGFSAYTQEITINTEGLYSLSVADPSGVSSCSAELAVYPGLAPGSINTTLREFCAGGTTVIGGTNPPYGPATGGSGLYSYTWQIQPGCSDGWIDIPGTNLTSYTPDPPPSTACYRRKAEDPVCGSVAYTDFKRFEIYDDPVSQSIVPSPPDPVICAGTPVSATFAGGSGGYPGGTTDVYEYSTDSGSTWTAYTPDQNIDTSGLTGTNILRIRTRRISTGVNGCNYGSYVTRSWSVNPVPGTSGIYHM
jgi:hypothetical protein